MIMRFERVYNFDDLRKVIYEDMEGVDLGEKFDVPDLQVFIGEDGKSIKVVIEK